MDLFRQTITVGVPYTIPLTGRHFRILTGTGKFRIKTDNGIDSEVLAGLGCDLTGKNGEPFHSVQITAVNNTQTVEIMVSDFPVTDSRLTGDVDINGLLSVVNAGGSSYAESAGTVADGASGQIVAGNGNRIKASLYIDQDCFVSGTSPATAAGYPLPAGHHVIENTAALYAFNDSGATLNFILLEELK